MTASPARTNPPSHAGALLARCLAAQGVERVFCVPGESYLPLLDGLHGGPVSVVVARHEGAAAMMAEAEGKMTGRPGVCVVTRGPGAMNAAAGIHIAAQDSTPMVLLVGLVHSAHTGREGFQEFDLCAVFGSLAKRVEVIHSAERIPEMVSRAWHSAMAGRPGPVVLGLPEDMLRATPPETLGPASAAFAPIPAPDPLLLEPLRNALEAAQSPIIVVGGSRWQPEDQEMLATFAERWGVPVACSFRRQGLMDPDHPCYAGEAGLGINPALKQRLETADLILLLGCRFSENPSQGFTVLPFPGMDLSQAETSNAKYVIQVHPGAEEIGRLYTPNLGFVATPGSFLRAVLASVHPTRPIPTARTVSCQQAHEAFKHWSDTPPAGVGAVTLSAVISHLRDSLPPTAMLCNGAGNYAIWIHRFFRYGFGAQLAPVSGSMGYGLPAAIAAALRHPERPVIALAGDGCFQMTGAELGTAVQLGLKLRILVCDNGRYGTIRMHQEARYPGRVEATDLVNPDFAALARSYGAVGLTVKRDSAFPSLWAEAMAAPGPALLHLTLDGRDIAPGRVLEQA
ncbi:MAG: thiamine pyrophosphate-dependent enzyme [Rhodospirillaceae bacterium]